MDTTDWVCSSALLAIKPPMPSTLRAASQTNPVKTMTEQELQRLADEYQRDAIADANALRPDEQQAEDLG